MVDETGVCVCQLIVSPLLFAKGWALYGGLSKVFGKIFLSRKVGNSRYCNRIVTSTLAAVSSGRSNNVLRFYILSLFGNIFNPHSQIS